MNRSLLALAVVVATVVATGGVLAVDAGFERPTDAVSPTADETAAPDAPSAADRGGSLDAASQSNDSDADDDGDARSDDGGAAENETLLRNAEVEVVDEDDVLTDAEAATVEDLLVESLEVDDSAASLLELLDREEAPDAWTVRVTEYDNPLVDSEGVVSAAIVPADADSDQAGTDSGGETAVVAHVALDDEEITQVLQRISMDEVELVDDAADVEVVEEGEERED